MTDRQFTNPLKGTVSPQVKIVPGNACRPQRLEAKFKLEMLHWLAIKQIWKIDCLPEQWQCLPRSICNKTWRQQDCRMLKWNGHLSSVMSCFFYEPSAIVWSSSVLSFLYYSKTSAVWNSNVWSSITSQTQSACKIALSNQASCSSETLWCWGSTFSLVKSLFHRGFKTDFIKCSISKWATHHSRKVMATLATWAVV